jgi:8-amino-7-oxononanoate synthase
MPGNSDQIRVRVEAMRERVDRGRERGDYHFNQPVTELRGGSLVKVHGREMLMFASYSYLGLLGHPRINAAAKAAIDKYGTGTHGVRLLAGTLDLHQELEATIAAFKGAEDAACYSSGYVTNLTAIATLVGRHDAVICDKLNHASIVDGCLLSGAGFYRFRHNDMGDLGRVLKDLPPGVTKLVVADAVFSSGGDILDLPGVARLCREHGAWLMVDEAHALGVLGRTGRGIEEHFGLGDAIDVKMGALSKAVPSVGGYLAGKKDLICYLKHASRAFIFSAAISPAQAAAAQAGLHVILDEPERCERLHRNAAHLSGGLRGLGFDTLKTETAIIPIVCGADEAAYAMARACHREGVFVLPMVAPAVPEGQALLRATVTAAHGPDEIDQALAVFKSAGRETGLI